jgi:phytol kinase
MPSLLELRALLPDPRTVLIMLPLSLASAALLGALAGRLNTRRGVATPYTRKLFHLAIFSLAAAVHLAGSTPAVLVFGTGVVLVVLYAVMRGEGYPMYEALARPSDSPHRTLFVLVPLATTALGGLASIWLFGAWSVVGYLVAGWGDALGEPVGTRWGRHPYRVPSFGGVKARRSLEGSAAVLIGGTAAAFVGLVAQGAGLAVAGPTALAAGACGALVEAVSTHGLDNFTVQLAASGITALIMG